MKRTISIAIIFLAFFSLQHAYAQKKASNTEMVLIFSSTTCLSYFLSPDSAYETFDGSGQKLSVQQVRDYFGYNSFAGDAWVIKQPGSIFGVFISAKKDTCTVIPSGVPALDFHKKYKSFMKDTLKALWKDEGYKFTENSGHKKSEIIINDKSSGQTLFYQASTKPKKPVILSFSMVKL